MKISTSTLCMHSKCTYMTLENYVDSYYQLGYGWTVIYRNQCVFHRPETVFERRHQIRNFLLTLHFDCQRVLLVNCTTYYYRIFEVDTGGHSTHIFLFLKPWVIFKIIVWPLLVLVHVKSESSAVPSLSEYVVIFLKNFNSDSKIFHGSPSPHKSHVNYI